MTTEASNAEYQDRIRELEVELETLRAEFSENTIIQSMNDMKDRYNHLVATTVGLPNYNKIKGELEEIKRKIIGVGVLVDHVINILKSIETETYMTNVKNKIYKIELELLILKEILEGE